MRRNPLHAVSEPHLRVRPDQRSESSQQAAVTGWLSRCAASSEAHANSRNGEARSNRGSYISDRENAVPRSLRSGERTRRERSCGSEREDFPEVRADFGTGLRARLEERRIRVPLALVDDRDPISPELALVSPELPSEAGRLPRSSGWNGRARTAEYRSARSCGRPACCGTTTSSRRSARPSSRAGASRRCSRNAGTSPRRI